MVTLRLRSGLKALSNHIHCKQALRQTQDRPSSQETAFYYPLATRMRGLLGSGRADSGKHCGSDLMKIWDKNGRWLVAHITVKSRLFQLVEIYSRTASMNEDNNYQACPMNRPYLVTIPAIIAMSFSPAHADLTAGPAAFQSKCHGCHASGPASFKTDSLAIPDMLSNGKVKPHRFTLTETQLNDLLDYIQSVRSSGTTP